MTLELPSLAKVSAQQFASLYACTTCKLGNMFKRSLQSVSRGSSEKLLLDFFIRWTIANTSSSTIKFGMFSPLANMSPSRRAHSSTKAHLWSTPHSRFSTGLHSQVASDCLEMTHLYSISPIPEVASAKTPPDVVYPACSFLP